MPSLPQSVRPRSENPVAKRLSGYWKMEAGNVVLLPAFLLWMIDGRAGLIAALCLAPTIGLLIIGTVYWRAKHRQLLGDRILLDNTLPWIARMQIPMLVGTVIALIAAVAIWLVPGLAVSPGERWISGVSALLALLEYINYYHRQLQHFDNAADFKRLTSGKGMRQSQMARDLEQYRRTRDRASTGR